METVRQIDTCEEARLNWEKTRQFLNNIEKRKHHFLEIGELLTECRDRGYWKVNNFGSFKQYVEDGLGDRKIDYSLATRFIKVHEFSRSPKAPPVNLAKINWSKLYLLVENHKKVTPDLWSRAHALTHKQVLGELGLEGGEPGRISDEESSRHTKIKRRIKELGEILGKYAKQEYPLGLRGADVVWKTSEQALGATHVFEVQHRGQLEHALVTLLDAYETLDSPRLFLIITVPEDGEKALQTVHTRFPQIEERFTVLAATRIDHLYTTLSRVREDLSRLT